MHRHKHGRLLSETASTQKSEDTRLEFPLNLQGHDDVDPGITLAHMAVVLASLAEVSLPHPEVSEKWVSTHVSTMV